MCFIPEADKRHLRALSGDPDMTGVVKEASPSSVGRLFGALLTGLPYSQRREAVREAMAFAATDKNGDAHDVVPLSALFPPDANVDQVRKLWNGLALMLLALGSASSDTSVGTVVANANAMATGAPFASDPMVGERQNEVVLAKAILEAALLDDETAQQWFKDNELLGALSRVAEYSYGGSSDADPRVISAMDRVGSLYDCVQHDEPLGGDVLNGGAVADFFKSTWNGVKQGLSDAIGKVASSAQQSLSGKAGGAAASSAARTNANAAAEAKQNASADAKQTTDATQVLSDQISAAKEAVEQAKAAMEDGKESLASYQAKLRDSALKSAKLQWAQAILESPDEVATILSATNPNMSDPGTFLQTMLATLPAAKQTGNLGTIKALVYALRSAASKGDGSANSLYELIAGDPVEQIDLSLGMTGALKTQREVVKDILGDALDGPTAGEHASAASTSPGRESSEAPAENDPQATPADSAGDGNAIPDEDALEA